MIALGTSLLVNLTVANGIYPLKEDCQAPPQEKGSKFKEGDLVSLKSGGPKEPWRGSYAYLYVVRQGWESLRESLL
jgi:hypothetical protein